VAPPCYGGDMNIRLAVVIGAALASASLSGDALADALPVLSAGDLAGFCQSKDIAIHNACKFFILGVFATTSVTDRLANGSKVCIPDDIPSDAMEFVVRDYMARDFEFFPKDREMPAISMVLGILVKQFPCPP
jgi:hypothetical protein